jgi:hypothetical protein
MKLGNKIIFFIILFFLQNNSTIAEDKISSTPLLNLNKIKPSFEDTNSERENFTTNQNLKKKKLLDVTIKTPHAVLIGLDKITAKSSQLVVNLNELKKFGPLEIKILKCGKMKLNNKIDDVAYMQVKDLTKAGEDKVFIFNGWTFASDPNVTPFDHAIYDLQLLNCNNV